MVGTRRRAAAAAQSGLLLAVIEDDLAAVQHELALPNPQWVSSEGGLTALHLAAGFASPAVMAALLAAPSLPPSLVNAQLQADFASQNVFHPLLESAVKETRLAFCSGATALHIAVYFGDADAVRLLLGVSAGPNIADVDGRTACHLATCSWLHCAAAGSGRQATAHQDIPGLLLQAGGDIFSPTCDSRGRGVHAPLYETTSYEPGAAACHTFLCHAAEQHAAGKWVPGPASELGSLVWRSVAVLCQPFFVRFWQHAQFNSEQSKISTFVKMGHVSGVEALLTGGSARPATQHPWPSMVEHAVHRQQADMVQLLLRHSVPVSCGALRAAVGMNHGSIRVPQPGMLRMLLEAGPPPEPEAMYSTVDYWTCPLLALLQGSTRRMWGPRPDEDRMWRSAAVQCMELMAEAGMKPHVYANIVRGYYPSTTMKTCDPLKEFPDKFRIHSSNSWLWRAYQRPAWTPATHRDFQRAFRDAVRTLLLAAHRSGQQAGRSTSAGLGALPQDVLLHIIGTAAYPTCAWV